MNSCNAIALVWSQEDDDDVFLAKLFAPHRHPMGRCVQGVQKVVFGRISAACLAACGFALRVHWIQRRLHAFVPANHVTRRFSSLVRRTKLSQVCRKASLSRSQCRLCQQVEAAL